MVPPAPDVWASGGNSSPFEPSLCRLRSPLPGNGISGTEKNAPIRPPNHGSAVSETKRSYKKPAATLMERNPQAMDYLNKQRGEATMTLADALMDWRDNWVSR
jgi:hypothetical protein